MGNQMPSVLVVDDSTTMRKMIISFLRPLQAHFREAGSGLDAIEQLALAPADLITLDLNMPDMHGLEFLQFLRGHQTLRSIPVLVVTSRSDDAMHKAVVAAGANGWLNKPFSPEALLQQVSELLPRQELDG